MATQAVLIAETIAGMKKAITRNQHSSESDDSIAKPSNRGNKLKRKAQYVREGQLDLPNGPKVYKRRIEHAGYHRYIISRNPRRFDEDGDELDDDDVDEQADAATGEDNPYGDIRLEHLLAPLTAAADLPNHPSLFAPYVSKTLTEMAKQAGDMVHRERRSLWNIKQLLTKFRGDQIWIPCEALQSESDIALFGPTPLYNGTSLYGSHQALVNGDEQNPTHAGGIIDAPEKPSDKEGSGQEYQPISTIDGRPPTALRVPDAKAAGETVNTAINSVYHQLDAEMTNAINGKVLAKKSESRAGILDGFNIQSANKTISQEGAQKQILGNNSLIVDDTASTPLGGLGNDLSGGLLLSKHPEGSTTPQFDATEASIPAIGAGSTSNIDNPELGDNGDGQPEVVNEDDELQSTPHRMTTRARAQAVSDNATSSHTLSPSPAPSIPAYIHPLYLVPSSARPDRDFGLPLAEAEETRRVLMSYAQKQEEVCRGAERLYEGLLKADRMRQTVLKWCKAEGHVGDASDGEDWYDKDEWGLEEDLKKGGEEDDEDAGNQGKKTRGRRA
ncbi:Transcriptional regulatory protein RXT2, N-terminal [Lasallia pustulata]|uniref:Transcriptional regulatory protein RXT2, N-terminal n=1 Tax=Lasallia pustulata TaxID=136370 RepID=A0A1W5D9T5_9LECA|nr:Transcriptional regulatory protein RXT2, N-terminal [Lasallia pustulata]